MLGTVLVTTVLAWTRSKRLHCTMGDGKTCCSLAEKYADADAIDRDLLLSARLHAAGCDHGYHASCTALGLMTQYGIGIARDADQARTLFLNACEAGDARACTSLGYMHAVGDAVPKEERRASEFYRRACDLGHMQACSYLGSMLVKGLDGQPDAAQGMALLRRACDVGDEEGCHSLKATELATRAEADVEGSIARAITVLLELEVENGLRQAKAGDLRGAAKIYEKACGKGLPSGCRLLGEAYQKGAGVQRSTARASKLIDKACSGGDHAACAVLAEMLIEGTKVAPNHARARNLFRKLCREEMKPPRTAIKRTKEYQSFRAQSCTEYGATLIAGLGGSPDIPLGLSHLEYACALGSGAGCHTAAIIHQQGRWTELNPTKAAELSERACELGRIESCRIHPSMRLK